MQPNKDMNNTYNSDYEVRLATLAALGGDVSKLYSSVYDVDLAILDAVINNSGGLEPIVSDSLPDAGEEGKIYFVPNEDPDVQDNYKEYIWVNDQWECIGNANVDLSNYYTKEEVNSELKNKVVSENVRNIVTLTEEEYDNLPEKDQNTCYIISE